MMIEFSFPISISRKSSSVICTLAVLLAAELLLASPAIAESPEDGLTAFLHKKYSKKTGWFGVADKILPRAPADQAASLPIEGQKVDGSYWSLAHFGRGNVSVLGWPHRTLSNYCRKSGGSLELAAPYFMVSGPPYQDVSLTGPGGGPDFVVSPAMFRGWAATPSHSATAENVERTRHTANSRNAELIDAKQVIGLFTCQVAGQTSAARPLWHIAILPAPDPRWRLFHDDAESGTNAAMLRVFAVTLELVERTNTGFGQQVADAKEKQHTIMTAAQQQNVERVSAERSERARIEAYQNAVAVGDDTNCGLVLGFKGPLVEVQVPSHVKLENGATRIFVKRSAIAPKRLAYSCYQYDMLTKNSTLGPSIDWASE